jgi:biopolymer transport protein ExbD
MIHSFGLLGGQEIEAPQAIAGGIAEALIATACGLAVAILALLPFNYLNAQLEGARNDIQDAASHLELQLARGRTTARLKLHSSPRDDHPLATKRTKGAHRDHTIDRHHFFLLATFVMVSLSMIKNRGIPVNLPTASSATPQDRSDYTAITVTAEGDLYFNKDAMSLQEVVEPLRALKMTTTDPLVFIHGDAKAEFGTAIAVLDEVRKLGIAKVAIGTKSR